MFSGSVKVNHLQKHLEKQKRASVDEGVENWGNLLHCSSAGKESACNAGDLGLILGVGRSAGYPLQYSWASLVAQLVKNPPTMRETWVRPLGSIPGLGRSLGWQRVGHDRVTFTSLHCWGE